MSDVTETAETETIEILPDEKSLLMQRARLMGLKVSPNIGIETLKARINTALEAEKIPVQEEELDEGPSVPPAIAANMAPPAKETESQKRARLVREATKLVRIRITCLNPAKKDLPGEIFTLGNRYIGTQRKFVPYGDQTQNGYHVPNCIYEHLRDAKFLHIRVSKDRQGRESIDSSFVPEYAIEVLPQLTPEELRRLAIQQAAAAGKLS